MRRPWFILLVAAAACATELRAPTPPGGDTAPGDLAITGDTAMTGDTRQGDTLTGDATPSGDTGPGGDAFVTGDTSAGDSASGDPAAGDAAAGDAAGGDAGPSGAIIFVNGVAAPGGDGSSWATALQTVQAAVDLAAPGDRVWVAAGTYIGNAPNEPVLTMRDGVSVFGGFTGIESQLTERPDPLALTYLSADFNGNAPLFADDSVHVIIGASNAVIDGFLVLWGRADDAPPDDRGGGMFNEGVQNLILRNMYFEGNFATALGGAVYNGNSDVTVEDTLIWFNDTDGRGAGMASVASTTRIRGGSLNFNWGTYVPMMANSAEGGGLALIGGSAVIENTLLNSNNADQLGGGLAVDDADVLLRDVVVMGNVALRGAGMFVSGSTPVQIERTIFHFNFGNGDGAGLSVEGTSLSLTDSAFLLNLSARAAAMEIDGAPVMASDVTFALNVASAGDGGALGQSGGTSTWLNASFFDNLAAGPMGNDGCGGAVILTSDSVVSFDNATFVANQGTATGGALCTGAAGTGAPTTTPPVVRHASFSENRGPGGGALWAGADALPTLANCALYDNEAVEVGFAAGPPAVNHTCAQQDLSALGTGPVTLGMAPFVPIGAEDQLYLDPMAGCVDAGDNATADLALGAGLWRAQTTRTDGLTESAVDGAGTELADSGRHFDPGAAKILSLSANATDVIWTSANASRCVLVDDIFSDPLEMVPAAGGTMGHTSVPGARLLLVCFGPAGEPALSIFQIP